MNRVVCPVCKAGFEAQFTREKCAINCVTCNVAFDASRFLPAPGRESTERYTGPVLINTTGADIPLPPGMPKPMSAPVVSSEPPKPRKAPSEIIAAPAQPKAVSPAKPANVASNIIPVASDTSVPAKKVMSAFKENYVVKNAYVDSAVIGVPTPSAKQNDKPAIEKPFVEPLVRPVVSEPLRSKKSNRRPLLEGCFGKYDIEGEIARGGVGAVFRARERDSGKPFALKVLIEGEDVGETERDRFRHECETAKALSLPGMVHVHEVGEHEGRPYMAMELIEGKSLDRVIAERSLTVNSCLVLMKSVAATVGALHEAGYVHRDLKPGNILLDQFDTPKVADFGLVKSLDEVTRMTASGLVCGTPAYMSPEQARGEGKNVDPRSDVWALGAVLYETLAGEPPFKADNALKLMLRITKEQPRKLSIANRKVPADVEAIVMKCLEKNPTRRYVNGRALASDIASFLEGGKLQVSTQSKVRQLISVASVNRQKIMPVAAAIAAVVIIGIVSHAVFSTRDATPLIEKGIASLKDNPQGDDAKLQTAQRYFMEAATIDPKSGRAYLGYGAALARRGIDAKNHKILNAKYVEDAFKANEKAAALDPRLKTEALATAARYNMWLGRYDVEAQYLERVVSLEPSSLEYRKNLAMAYWNAGVQVRKSKYYQLAVQEFKAILVAKPDYPGVADHIRNIERNFLAQPTASVVSMTVRN